jgi:hypothetical protein
MSVRKVTLAAALAAAVLVPVAAEAYPATATGTVNLRSGPGTGFARLAVVAPRFVRPLPPRYGYMQRPWWDNRNHAWYDGRRWYFNGRWYDRPSGFSFGFGFGG